MTKFNFFMLLASIALAGCGSGIRPSVSGVVTYKGEPVGHQTLILEYAGGGDAGKNFSRSLILDAEGKFAGDAPEPGLYKVVIELPMAAREGHSDTPGAKLKIPVKYRSKSELTWEIAAGGNRRDFVLVD